MGNLKTKKGVAKRFKITKKGKIKFFPGGKSHLATCKEPERKRKLRKSRRLSGKKEAKAIKRVLPHG